MNGLALGPGPCVSRYQHKSSVSKKLKLTAISAASSHRRQFTRTIKLFGHQLNANNKAYTTTTILLPQAQQEQQEQLQIITFIYNLKKESCVVGETLRCVGLRKAAAPVFSSAWSQ